jgi:hypothetical protein
MSFAAALASPQFGLFAIEGQHGLMTRPPRQELRIAKARLAEIVPIAGLFGAPKHYVCGGLEADISTKILLLYQHDHQGKGMAYAFRHPLSLACPGHSSGD